MFDLERTILERHSTRLFLSQPVPRGLVEGGKKGSGLDPVPFSPTDPFSRPLFPTMPDLDGVQ